MGIRREDGKYKFRTELELVTKESSRKGITRMKYKDKVTEDLKERGWKREGTLN